MRIGTFRESRLIAVAVVVVLGLSSATFLVGPAAADDSIRTDAPSVSGPDMQPTHRTTVDEVAEAIDLPRTVSYRWYDMFNVPFDSYWDRRWDMTGVEEPLTHSYPYIYRWHGAPLGNVYYYSDCRLNTTARNMSEINMNERPEFLPFLGTQRGGNALLDWHWTYMTHDEVLARFPPTVAAWDDGWFLRFNGTTTLDKQAAKAVLDLTDDGYDNFDAWWSVNNGTKSLQYQDWLKYEGNVRLDIFNMYDYTLSFLDWVFWATREGEDIVIHYDHVTWGMEALMTRWMRESFMPTEWYFYDSTFHMDITPSFASLDFDSAVMYCLYMYETTLVEPGQTHGDPCWVWEAMMQDYLDRPGHPSVFKPYKAWTYLSIAPGSQWYGSAMNYDYTPGTWNLSAGETLQFEWPAGEQVFIAQAFDAEGNPLLGQTVNLTAKMAATYSEPDTEDFPSQINVDSDMRTITFTGPIDMWTWSKDQTAHAWLQAEWQRIGLLPYGIPWIEFGMVGPEPTGPKIDYRLYDMFEPEYGQWFSARDPWYYQDYMLRNETHKHTHLYLPDQGANERALIYAPYRWSRDATNIDWVTASHPYIMPTTGPAVEGAEVAIDLNFTYITWDSWNKYWIPTWGWIRPDHPYNETPIMRVWYLGQADGYQVGAVYNITMNREAAYQWLGMPISADVATWYDNGNSLDFLYYQFDWMDWIYNEANNRLDIFAGYNDLFYYGFNWMKVAETPTGDVRLTIAEVDWGYEVLITRWLTEANLNPHEPYWEDFKLKATLTENGSDIWFDAVGMYNLHAVKANQSATNEGAWAWEPVHIDYVPSWSAAPYHPSEFDSYANLTYICWESGTGEPNWGQPVGYTSTPSRFDLAEHMTLTVQLPQGPEVPFYLGQPVPSGSIERVRQGDLSDYTALEYNAAATLGFTIPSLASHYDPGTQTLVLQGPMSFDNPRGSGGLLYHGAPWIEIGSAPSELPYASTISLTGLPDDIQRGESTSALVAVYDQYGALYSNFTSMVVFSSTDPMATLPAAYNFTHADSGMHLYSGIVLRTSGVQNISVQVAGMPWLWASDSIEVISANNTPPVASFTVMPDHGNSQSMFSADASSSHDAESGLTYRWDWEGDGYWDTGWSSNSAATHSYGEFGVYEIVLEVMDAEGLNDSTSASVSVGVDIRVKGNHKASTVMWIFTPSESCNFTLMFENDGLRGVKIDVVDITNAHPQAVLSQRMRLAEDYATYASEPMTLFAGHVYLFKVVPNGHKGTGALAYGDQTSTGLPPLEASFVAFVSFFTVTVDASGSTPSDLIAIYVWDWGDGQYGYNVTAAHTYGSAQWGGYWTITLTIIDVYGRTAWVTNEVAILPL